MKISIGISTTLVLGFLFTGCSSYRTDSGLSIPAKNMKPEILVTTSSLNDKNCKKIKDISASIKKLTAFHDDPTKEQVDYVLAKKGKKLHANVIRNATYKSGVGFTTWGYMDGFGEAAKCEFIK